MQSVRSVGRGRPRAFDEARFLDGAIALFSASGFSGVSISDITMATGLTIGSVYKAYGDKEGLFVEALRRYVELREAQVEDIVVGAADARAKLGGLVRFYVDLCRGRDGELGCLVVAGVTDLDHVGRAAEFLRSQLSRRQATLVRLIEEGRRDGSIATHVNPQATASVLLALLQGMRVIGKAGAFPEDGDAFVASALKLLE